jgi:hypothetical protein
MRCERCGSVIEQGDAFCGSCGAPAGIAGNESSALRQIPAARAAPSSGRFFFHAQPRPAGRMTNATRYLSAAAYLSPAYAGAVIRELVASHRAVAPSVGIDLGPIIRHCLRARSIQLTRDIIFTVLLIIGLVLARGQTILILVVALFAGFLPSVNWARKSMTGKALAAVGAFVLVAIFVVGLFVIKIANSLPAVLGSLGSSNQGFPGAEPSSTPSLITPIGAAVLAAMIVTQVTYVYVRSRTLCDELGPDASPRRARPRSAQVEARIARAEAAQHGNLVLYSGENPFIGTGARTRVWSIAIELQRRTEGRQQQWGPSRSEDYVPIDPVELHQVIRDRLLELKDDALPPNERLSALVVQDHIVGLGLHRWDSPVIDPDLNVPYSHASPEAVAALIRHPQAGLRYYQRASVCDVGQAVWAGQERVIDGSDQDIASSAFVYVAVEGRMLYLEFVATVMPPVHDRWYVVDLLPRISAGKFFVKVLLDAFSAIFSDLIHAPFRTVGSLVTMAGEGRSYKEEATAAEEYVYGDIGAQVSVRQMGAAGKLQTYIQKLDAEKYTKLAERLVTDTVLDFLAAKGVDTSSYVNNASTVINSGVMISGGTFTGPAAFGAGATAQQHNQAQPARG